MQGHWKLWEKAALLALCAALLSGTWAQGEQAALEEGLIRLHVIAASDEGEEQAVKLRVRDAVLAYLDPLLAEAQTREEAGALLLAHLDGVAEAAAGSAGGRQVTVTLGPAMYGPRSFEGGVLPAGRYESLRVTLGAGEGHNWWGLLFPQLALPAAQAPGEQTEELREALARSGVRVVPEDEGFELRFWVLDAWSGLREALTKKSGESIA